MGKYEQVADALFQNQPNWSNDGKVFETVASALTPAEQKKVQALAKDPGVLTEVDQEVQEGQAERGVLRLKRAGATASVSFAPPSGGNSSSLAWARHSRSRSTWPPTSGRRC